MMRLSFLFLSLFFVCNYLSAQRREKLRESSFNSQKFKSYEVEFKKKVFDSLRVNYINAAEFIDARADNSKIGFIRAGDNNQFYNLIFPEQTDNYINTRVGNLYKKSQTSKNKLTIVCRRLWLSQIIVKAKLLRSLLLDSKSYLSYAYIDCDLYSEKEGKLQYLGKMDTVISMGKWMGHATSDLVKTTLINTIIFGDSLAGVMNQNPYTTREALMNSLIALYQYPILKATNYKDGVYLSYKDFLQNTPLEGSFEIDERKGEEYILFIGKDTSETNNAWGYCKDGIIYKHLNDAYYKMNRVANTFELAGPRVIQKLYTKENEFFVLAVNTFFQGVIGFGTTMLIFGSDKSIMKELIPYQLDIMTGSYY